MWGIRSAGFRSSRQRRFIPTYVGHTMNSSRTIRKSLPVHPHIRGAYWQGLEIPPALGGSSPHTWGIPSRRGCSPIQRRFIPTYVGHTTTASSSRKNMRVHPHIRGAYTSSSQFLVESIGSSPHTWGILFHHIFIIFCQRFIPTYVGHT